MSLLGSGLLAIWHNLKVNNESDLRDFQNWYRAEHFPERLSVPGFLRGRRYHSIDSDTRFSALYETKNLETLGSKSYHHQLDHPTPWSRTNLARFQDTNRTAFEVVYSAGFGGGGGLGIISVVPSNKDCSSLKDWVINHTISNLLHETDTIGAHLCIPDPLITKVDSVEAEIRDVPDQIADWCILIESRDQSSLALALGKHFLEEEWINNGASSVSVTKHQLMHCATAGETANFSG